MLPTEELDSLLSRIKSYRNDYGRGNGELPSGELLTDRLSKALKALKDEEPAYRPTAGNGEAGGLLDFTGKSIPVVIVPDLHARPNFLIRLLSCTIKGQKVLDALNEGNIIVVCVGDGVHTERVRDKPEDDAGQRWEDDYARWMASYEEFERGNINCPSMQEEVGLGLATMMTVMELKAAFPEHFHFLKGNHENVKNIEGGGDHAFRKFALEGQMVKEFVETVYGASILDQIRDFETSLPIVAIFDRFCVSHAEPAYPFTRDEIINYHDEEIREYVILAFTWTANDEAEEGSVASIFADLTGREPDEALWFGGHRPVKGKKYLLRQDGHYIQIHNPDEMNVVYVSANRPFDIERAIISLD